MNGYKKTSQFPAPALWSPSDAVAAILRMAGAIATGRLKPADARPGMAHPVPPGFIGVCAAAHPDPAGDDYIIDRLRELNIEHVRLDLTYSDAGDHQRRLLSRLLDAQFKICLHLVQPRAEAWLMSETGGVAAGAAERWRVFVDKALTKWGSRVECVEVGATCNRRKWSGQSLAGLLVAWRTAWHAAKTRGIKIIGPNATDFEPIYNFHLLNEMRRMGCPADVHTDNLFVERAVEPESFDHKILGRAAAGLLRCNLIRKARLLHEIGAIFDTPEFYCTHVTWSLRRIARFLDHTEQKQADYLTRYFLLAAASGAIGRIYWGPLIGQREGLIDDGTDEYPDPPHVTLYNKACGDLSRYRIRPAFHALMAVNNFLRGAFFQKALTSAPHLEILEFKTSDGAVRHAVWTTNSRCAAASICYAPPAADAAICHDRDGRRCHVPPLIFTESPVFLSWNQPPQTQPNPVPAIWRIARHDTGQSPAIINTMEWTGIFQTHADDDTTIDPQTLIAAVAGGGATGADMESTPARHRMNQSINADKILRAGRNRVWSQPTPWNATQTLIIKQFKIPGRARRLLDCFKPGKAVRSWNGAQELLRRGLATPAPLAALIPGRTARNRPGYYICADYRPDCAVRDVFTALAGGHEQFRRVSADNWYADIADFLIKMHDRGVFFRDLSAGNVLARRAPSGDGYEFALIDTARARFYPWRLPLHRRLSDLTRICHPLHRTGRQRFLTIYMLQAGRKFRAWMRLPLLCYDAKHVLKNAIKPLRRNFARINHEIKPGEFR